MTATIFVDQLIALILNIVNQWYDNEESDRGL